MDIWKVLLTSTVVSAVISSMVLFLKDIYNNHIVRKNQERQEKRNDLKEILKKLTCYQDNLDVMHCPFENDDEKRLESIFRSEFEKFLYYKDKYDFCKIYLPTSDINFLEGLLLEIDIHDLCYSSTIKTHDIESISTEVFNFINYANIFENELLKILQKNILIINKK